MLLAPQTGYGVGVKELQVFDSGSVTSVPGTVGGTVPPTLSLDTRRGRELRGVHAGRGARVLGEHDRERDLDRR